MSPGDSAARPPERGREPGVPAAELVPAPAARAPARPRSCLGSLVALGGVGVGALYMANLTWGIDFLPDNLAIIGNIDEAAATTMLVLGLQYLFGKGRRD